LSASSGENIGVHTDKVSGIMFWEMLKEAEEEALAGGISRQTAEKLVALSGADVVALAGVAARVRSRLKRSFDICSLVNAKSGQCSEDCSQSAHHGTDVPVYPLLGTEEVVARAEEALRLGAKRFCIVTSGRTLSEEEFSRVVEMFERLKEEFGELKLDASLGELDAERARRLKKAGVSRYNHNIETAPSFYGRICSTHPFKERLKTAECVKDAGMELCCGGIIGLGEGWEERLEMAFTLKGLSPDCVPINLLIPHKGTPLEGLETPSALEAIKCVSLIRLIIPDAVIKVAGGRERLGDFQGFALAASADGIIVGGYLTTRGRAVDDDLKMLEQAEEFLSNGGR